MRTNPENLVKISTDSEITGTNKIWNKK